MDEPDRQSPDLFVPSRLADKNNNGSPDALDRVQDTLEQINEKTEGREARDKSLAALEKLTAAIDRGVPTPKTPVEDVPHGGRAAANLPTPNVVTPSVTINPVVTVQSPTTVRDDAPAPAFQTGDSPPPAPPTGQTRVSQRRPTEMPAFAAEPYEMPAVAPMQGPSNPPSVGFPTPHWPPFAIPIQPGERVDGPVPVAQQDTPKAELDLKGPLPVTIVGDSTRTPGSDRENYPVPAQPPVPASVVSPAPVATDSLKGDGQPPPTGNSPMTSWAGRLLKDVLSIVIGPVANKATPPGTVPQPVNVRAGGVNLPVPTTQAVPGGPPYQPQYGPPPVPTPGGTTNQPAPAVVPPGTKPPTVPVQNVPVPAGGPPGVPPPVIPAPFGGNPPGPINLPGIPGPNPPPGGPPIAIPGLPVPNVGGAASELGRAFKSERFGDIGSGVMGAAAAASAGSAIAPVFLLGKAAMDSVEKLRKFSDELITSNFRFAEFSGAMAKVAAEKELRDIKMSKMRGDALAESTGRLAESQSKLDMATLPWEIAWARTKADLLEKLTASTAAVVNAINNAFLGEPKKGDGVAYGMMDWIKETGVNKLKDRPPRFPRD